MFKGLKAIGWYLPKYDRVQVSTNITDVHQSPMHLVFEAISQKAEQYGTTVTGSELVGLIPLDAIEEAGRFFMSKNNLSIATENDLIEQAIAHLGLNELYPFYYKERILEFLLMNKT